jgi:uncharacterized protein YceK
MRKKNRFIAGVLVIVFMFGIVFTGCATTRQHQINFESAQGRISVSEVYIRNAGTSDWGLNLARDLHNIDRRSMFSDMVDVRVVDHSGFVYSKYNVPFNNDAFEINRTSHLNVFGSYAYSALYYLIIAAVLAGLTLWAVL